MLTLNSALLILHTRYGASKATLRSEEYHWAMARTIAKTIVATSQTSLDSGSLCLKEVSPIVLYSTYKAATVYIRVNRDDPSQESAQALETLKSALRMKNRRWKAAGILLSTPILLYESLITSSRCIPADLGSSRSHECLLGHIFTQHIHSEELLGARHAFDSRSKVAGPLRTNNC